jgi:hypothetical protein
MTRTTVTAGEERWARCSETEPRRTLATSLRRWDPTMSTVAFLACRHQRPSGKAVSDLSLAHDRRLNLLDVGEGVVHDRRGRSPIESERRNRPRRRLRRVLIGAHDKAECTSKCRLVSCELESPVPQSGPSTPTTTWNSTA